MTHGQYARNIRKHNGYCVQCKKAVWVSRNGESNIGYVGERDGAKVCLDCAVCAHNVSFRDTCHDCAMEVAELFLFG